MDMTDLKRFLPVINGSCSFCFSLHFLAILNPIYWFHSLSTIGFFFFFIKFIRVILAFSIIRKMSTNTASHFTSKPSSSSNIRKLPPPRVHISFLSKDSDWTCLGHVFTPITRLTDRPERDQNESSHPCKSHAPGEF